MISTRREIVNEQDRYGGYASSQTGYLSPDIDVPETSTSRADSFSYRTYGAPERSRKPEQELTYSPRPEYPGIEEYIGLSKAPTRSSAKPAKKKGPRESEDVMPSIKTRAYADEALEEAETVRHAERQEGMSTKAKLMLCAYVATVLILAAIVIATGIAISGVQGNVASLQYELNQKNAVILSQQEALSDLSDETYITGEAVEQGMKKIESTEEVELIELVEPPEYDARTNWFDKFCDWLSNIMGE